MNTRSLPDGSLAIDERWTLLRTACAAGAVLLPMLLVLAEAGNDAIRYGRIAGGVLGAMLLLLIAAIVEDRHFVFDAARRVLTWKQRNWFRSRAGHLSFGAIRDVLVTAQRSRDDDSSVDRSSIKYSCVLVTDSGQMPLTSTFGYVRSDYELLAAAVRAVIGAQALPVPRPDGGNPGIDPPEVE